MEVLNNGTRTDLSNYEVLSILQDTKSNKKLKVQKQLATITYETILYLEETPCINQTPEKIHNFLTALNSFKLTRGEKLSLLNLCPKTHLEMQLIIEDSEDRFTEEEIDALLEVISKHLDPDNPKKDENGDQEVEEENTSET